ncbi:MAG: alternative ribosome rescue aminoacyl-tRNA hydrolase ArfB [Sphingobacteriaceae bacterium]
MLYLTSCNISARLSKTLFLVMDFDPDLIIRELEFKTSRAGGRGGQHVNKVSSKVLLSWDLWNSSALNGTQKALIADRLAGRVTKHGVLQLEVSEDRSQIRNRKLAVDRLIDLLHVNLKRTIPRIKTKTPKSVVLSRLDRKKKMSQKKDRRRWRFED